MSAKLSSTTADYLSWEQNVILIRKLSDDKEHRLSLLVALGTFFGLRISDILCLEWTNIVDKDEFTLIEGKTKKSRTIKINAQLQKHIRYCYESIKPLSLDQPIFLSQKKTTYSVQRINVLLKEIKVRYNLKIKNFSSHTFRKTFGRQVFEASGTNAELSLVKLSQLFNHSNTLTTRKYLGIAKKELMEAYDLLSF